MSKSKKKRNITCTAKKALKKLKKGNISYQTAKKSKGNISLKLRKKTCAKGQKPFAVIVTCGDSRVIPESIFSAGIGDLFVIRVAGNVIDNHQLGSIEYAVGHLGCRLVLVMGHSHCGAVDAAIKLEPQGYIKFITDEIRKAIGEETDNYKACCLNVRHSVKKIEENLKVGQNEEHGLCVRGALYHIENGKVEFL